MSVRAVDLELDGKVRRVRLSEGEAGQTSEATLDNGEPLRFDARELEPGVLSLLLFAAEGDGSQGRTRSFRCVLERDAAGTHFVVVGGVRHAFALSDPRSLKTAMGAAGGAEGPRPLKCPMPGRVVRVLVAAGDQVEQGQGLVVVEAMKMQNELKSPKAGRVAKLTAGVGDTVAAGEVLLVVE